MNFAYSKQRMKKWPLVSVIIPVLNEEENLKRSLKSITKLDYPRKKIEIIVVDGGSKDNSKQVAKTFKAKVIDNFLELRGAGCQKGLEIAKGSIIAFTDADCKVPPNWLKGLIKYMDNTDIASVGGPNVTPPNDSLFARVAGDTMMFLTGMGSRYGYKGQKVIEIFHNPGCNVIYRKSAIVKAGGFNKALVTCEDEELDFRLRSLGFHILYTPKIIVDHYRRPTYRKILIQSYRYAVGRAQAIKLHPPMGKIFHFIPSVGAIIVFVNIFAPIINSHLKSISDALIILILIGSIIISIYLSLTRTRTYFTAYFIIIWLWFWGWAIGFIRGLM